MAFPNEILVGRYGAILHKLLSMKEGNPSPSLTPDIFPTIALEVDRIEWQFLGGTHPAMGVVSAAAGAAGTTTQAGLWNPDTSGSLVVVEQLIPAFGFVNAVNIRIIKALTQAAVTAGGWTSSGLKGFRDLRLNGQNVPAAQLLTRNSASGIGSTIGTILPAVLLVLPVQFVLQPGDFVHLRSTVEAAALEQVNWFWRERPLEPSETR